MKTIENLIRLFILKYSDFSFSLEEAGNELYGMIVKDETKELSDYGMTPEEFVALCFFLKGKGFDAGLFSKMSERIYRDLLPSFGFADAYDNTDTLYYSDVFELYNKIETTYKSFITELQSSTPFTTQEKFFAHSKNADFVQIMHNLPENAPLYKDSGLWQVRTDDMQEVIAQQTANESFEDFIRRYSDAVNKPNNNKAIGETWLGYEDAVQMIVHGSELLHRTRKIKDALATLSDEDDGNTYSSTIQVDSYNSALESSMYKALNEYKTQIISSAKKQLNQELLQIQVDLQKLTSSWEKSSSPTKEIVE